MFIYFFFRYKSVWHKVLDYSEFSELPEAQWKGQSNHDQDSLQRESEIFFVGLLFFWVRSHFPLFPLWMQKEGDMKKERGRREREGSDEEWVFALEEEEECERQSEDGVGLAALARG